MHRLRAKQETYLSSAPTEYVSAPTRAAADAKSSEVESDHILKQTRHIDIDSRAGRDTN